MLLIFADDELATVARTEWTPLDAVYRREAERLDAWASRRTGPAAARATRRAQQLRERLTALCTLDQLGADVDDPDADGVAA